ncbi:threonine ammonia-lyase [Streptomyces endophyticus]|uniref:Threonine/serine dehydratase n=1 Tax=Streptomyces endophyticus TaxID=714166 RepID=A0ABU6F179_9ACTN|nr:threonine/serine dehydratase [Streptomyces endophyticus]MEB8337185.1 threonine/serine dehydratase [Streptomyces endophyticus]
MITVADVEAEAERIARYVVRTPTVPSPGLSELLGAPTTAKLELLQRTGSFKARGATARLLTLSGTERAAGVVTVSGGNHGIALAVMAGMLDVKATVVMPRTAPASARGIAESAGASVHIADTMDGAFALVDELRDSGLTLIHPFDDPVVIAAQGTVGLEFAQDAGELTDVVVSIGGGGLASGVATAMCARRRGIRVWGVETEGAQAMSAALDAGRPTPVALSSIVSTLSAPSASQLTYEHVSALLTDVLTVTDAEAVQGTLDLANHAKVWAEPAAGCLLPASRQVLARVGEGAKLGLVICGGNATTTDVSTLAERFGLS